MMERAAQSPILRAVYTASISMRWATRAPAIALIIATASLLITASQLEADRLGYNTHQQLGLPPCGFLLHTGLPCATCGMTTAFTYAAHGQLVLSFLTQPAGMVFAVVTMATLMISSWILLTGASPGPLISWLWQPLTIWIVAALVILSWLFKYAMIIWKIQL